MEATSKNKVTNSSAVGRRKTATAYVRLTSDTPIVINNTYNLESYFKDPLLIHKIKDTITQTGFVGMSIKLKGGGISAQAEALQFALRKIAIKLDEDKKQEFKGLGLKLSDNRMVERKKIGLKKARKKYPFRRR